MRWIVLTGVNGFIGHNLLLQFLDASPGTLIPEVDKVVGSDLPTSLERDTYGRTQGHPRLDFVLAPDLLKKLEASVEAWGPPLAVIHNGACSSTTETDPEVFRTLNLESSQQLFRFCARHQIPFLYASSASVYGDGELGFNDQLERNDQYQPMNMYGRSKHDFDSWVLEQAQRPSVWFGMRYFNVFGAFEAHKKGQASILHWGRRQILDGGVLRLFQSHVDDLEDGHQKRDFVSVQDILRVTGRLLALALEGQRFPEGGRFVNIGRGKATSWLEMAEALFQALEKPYQVEFIPMPPALREHYQNYTQAELGTLHDLGIREPFLEHVEAFRQALKIESAAHSPSAKTTL